MGEETITEAVRLIQGFTDSKGVSLEKVVVFGSYAQGRYDEESDLDIAIITKDFEGKDIFERTRMLQGLMWTLIKELKLPLDIVFFSSAEWHNSSTLFVELVKNGKTLSF